MGDESHVLVASAAQVERDSLEANDAWVSGRRDLRDVNAGSDELLSLKQRGYRELRVVSGVRSGEQVAATLDRFAIVVLDET